MDREIEMVIRIPEEQLKNFRVFIVTHGGEIALEKRKPGIWLWDRGARTCNVCGQMRYIGKVTVKDNYCPNCGTRMKDGE